MKFTVMNKHQARGYTYKTHDHNYIIISINNTNDGYNKFNPDTKELIAVRSFFFDDVEKDEENCITSTDADNIIKFINKHMDVDECIVHCEAGVSRSAGVAAALMLIVNGSDKDIFDNPKYCPNRTCYTEILNAYYGSYNEDEIEEKYKHNIEIWRKYNLD